MSETELTQATAAEPQGVVLLGVAKDAGEGIVGTPEQPGTRWRPESIQPDVRRVELFRKRPRGGKGELTIDNRAAGGMLHELNTMTCGHCFCVVILRDEKAAAKIPGMPVRTRGRNWCAKCNRYTCDDRECVEECTPLEQCLELILKYPGLPALSRNYDGSLLFDRALLSVGKVY